MKRCPICQTTFNDEANFCPMDAGRLVAIDGPAPAATSAAPANDKLLGGRFAVGSVLGGGHTGDVFTARDEQTGAQVVVKLVSPKVFPTPMAAQRTERELKLMPKVASERVTKVLESGKTSSGQLWVAMEMVNGVPLAEVVAANGPLPTSQALRYALEVGEALAEAAKVGVIHRDVSPKNILVTDGDHVKLLNFSLPVPVTDKVFGAPEFLSPEQADGKPVDQRSNIYGLGSLLYFMVTGEPPFTGEPDVVLQQVKGAAPPPPTSRAPGLVMPPDLERTLMKTLEKQSSKRHLTLRQLLGELEAIANGQPVPRTAPPYAPIAGTSPSPTAASGETMLGHPVFGSQGAPPPAGSKTSPMGTAPPPAELPAYAAARPDYAPPPPQQYTPPQQGAPIGVQDAPTAPAPPAPMVAPPVVAPPQPELPRAQVVPPAARVAPMEVQGKRNRPAEEKPKKGKFRETMWFKKGELDEAAANTAAVQPGQGGIPLDKADEMPIEDRYKDDGSVSHRDRERLSLKTGHTQMMPAIKTAGPSSSQAMSEAELAKEVTGGRGLIIAIVVGAVVLAGVIVAIFVL